MSDFDDAVTPDDFPDYSDAELDEVLELLRSALSGFADGGAGAVDPVPEAVLEGARWVHDWANMDAELAALTFDSSADQLSTIVRSASQLRSMSFECERLEVAIQLESGEAGVTIVGSVIPPTPGAVTVLVGGIDHQGEIDDLGNFVIEAVNHGVVMAYVTTEYGTVRLGSFEA